MSLIPTTQVNVSPDDYKRKMAYALMMQGADASPIQHWTQGLARLAQGGIGGYEMYRDEQKQKTDEADKDAAYAKILAALQPGAGTQPAVAPNAAPPAPPAPMARPQAPIEPVPPPRQPVAEIPGIVRTDPNGRIAGNITSPSLPSDEKPAQVASPPPTSAAAALSAPQGPTEPQTGDARARLAAALLQGSRAERIAGRGLTDILAAQAIKPQDFDFKDRGDGTLVAINKHNPADVRVVQNNGQSTIKFEADKAGAIEQAKRTGGVEYESAKAGGVKRAELQAAKDIAKPDQDKQAQESGGIVTQDIDRALKLVDNKNGTLPTTGGTGNLLSKVGGTAAHDLEKLTTGIKANIGFAELQKMRLSSPTGGALGAISERENELLQSVKGSLDQSQTKEQLKFNLRRMKNVTLDIIHGPGNGPAREQLVPPKVKSTAEARNYPKGTEIELPDGSIGVVP